MWNARRPLLTPFNRVGRKEVLLPHLGILEVGAPEPGGVQLALYRRNFRFKNPAPDELQSSHRDP